MKKLFSLFFLVASILILFTGSTQGEEAGKSKSSVKRKDLFKPQEKRSGDAEVTEEELVFVQAGVNFLACLSEHNANPPGDKCNEYEATRRFTELDAHAQKSEKVPPLKEYEDAASYDCRGLTDCTSGTCPPCPDCSTTPIQPGACQKELDKVSAALEAVNKKKKGSASGAGHIHGTKRNQPLSNLFIWLGVSSIVLPGLGALGGPSL